MSGKMTMVGTAIAVCSSMIGTVLLILPQTFLRYGLLTCLFVVVLAPCMQIPIAVVLAYTCSLWAKHLKEEDPDIADLVERVLGPRWCQAFRVSSSLALCMLTCVIFLLIADLLYELLVSLFDKLEVSFDYDRDTIGVDFSRFSVQYLGIALLVPAGWLISLKSIHRVLQLSKLAMVCLILYFILVVTFFAENVSAHRPQTVPLRLWAVSFPELINAVSILSFAVVAHPSISPILKENQNYRDGQKSVFLGFGMATLLYVVCGVLGQIGLAGRDSNPGSSILDFFKGEWLEPAIGIPSIIYLLCIFPIYPYVARKQLLTERLIASRCLYYCFSFILVDVIAIMVVNNLDPGKLISFIGAVMCWLVCYMLPLSIDYKLRHGTVAAGSLLESSEGSADLQSQPPPTAISNRVRDILGGIILLIGSAIMLGELYTLFVA